MSRISVVVPVYNAEKYIAETLASIAAQSFSDFEAHIVDDCSTDTSADVIKAFCEADQRFSYHLMPTNCGGPAGPRNHGIAAAGGEFVAFCDADDIWVSYKLELQLIVADETDADVIAGMIRDFNDGDQLPHFERPNGPMPIKRISHRNLLIKNRIAMSSALVRQTSLAMVGGFNAAKSHVAVEDYDIWLRITGMGGRAVRLAVPLVHYRKLAASLSSNKMEHVSKAVKMIKEDYERRGRRGIFSLIWPLHWILYVGTAVWTRAVRRTL